MTEDQIVAIIKALSAGSPPMEQSEANTALAITCLTLCRDVIMLQGWVKELENKVADLGGDM